MIRPIVYLVIAASLCSCGSGSSNNQRPSTQYEDKKKSIAETERESPMKFLKVTASHHGNLLNQTVVEGEVVNNATLVSYKNIEVQITFLDKDGAKVDKEKHTLDNVVKPNSSTDFKIKTGKVKDAVSVSVDITSAVADK